MAAKKNALLEAAEAAPRYRERRTFSQESGPVDADELKLAVGYALGEYTANQVGIALDIKSKSMAAAVQWWCSVRLRQAVKYGQLVLAKK